MTDAVPFSRLLPSLELSFQAEAEWTGAFQLDGHRPSLSLEPDGWLVASVSLVGAPEGPAAPTGRDLRPGQSDGRSLPASGAARR